MPIFVSAWRKTWKNLIDGLSKRIKKRELPIRSGAATLKLPICKLYEKLLFLKDSNSHQKLESNFNFTNIKYSTSMFSCWHHISVSTTLIIIHGNTNKLRESDSNSKRTKRSEPDNNNSYRAAIVESLKMKLSPDAHYLLRLVLSLQAKSLWSNGRQNWGAAYSTKVWIWWR